MKLTVKLLNGDVKQLEVSTNATVGELKQVISQDFNEPRHKQKLSINNGRPFQVFVRNEKGQTKTYDVDANETVDQLQTKIFRKESVPKDQQRLIYNGRQLEAGMKLQDYEITSGSTIHMTLRLRGG